MDTKSTISVYILAATLIITFLIAVYAISGAIVLHILRDLSLTSIEMTAENILNVGILLGMLSLVTNDWSDTDE
mgnify:CR=1 FL=1